MLDGPRVGTQASRGLPQIAGDGLKLWPYPCPMLPVLTEPARQVGQGVGVPPNRIEVTGERGEDGLEVQKIRFNSRVMRWASAEKAGYPRETPSRG